MFQWMQLQCRVSVVDKLKIGNTTSSKMVEQNDDGAANLSWFSKSSKWITSG